MSSFWDYLDESITGCFFAYEMVKYHQKQILIGIHMAVTNKEYDTLLLLGYNGGLYNFDMLKIDYDKVIEYFNEIFN